MDEEPHRSVRASRTRDGLAAVAVTLLTVSLIVFLASKIV